MKCWAHQATVQLVIRQGIVLTLRRLEKMLDCSLRNQTCSILDSIQYCCRHRVTPQHRYSSLSNIALLGSRHQSFIRREAQHRCRASSSFPPVNVRGRRKAGGNEELPSWIAWDQEALKQQAASLIELQVRSSAQALFRNAW